MKGELVVVLRGVSRTSRQWFGYRSNSFWPSAIVPTTEDNARSLLLSVRLTHFPRIPALPWMG